MDGSTDDFAGAEVFELRQYTLHPGAREALVGVFERHFVEGQQEAGIALGGIFRDEADPDRFVWMRGFASAADRGPALERFYYGPIWAAHRDTANATMIDSDDVLMLEAIHPPRPASPRPSPDERVHVAVHPVEPGRTDALAALRPVLERHLRTAVAMWRSAPGPNTFPALPVRPEDVVVWSATFPDGPARTAALERLHGSPDWMAAVSGAAPQELALAPTARSLHPAP